MIVNVDFSDKILCQICHKAEATKQCDAPIGVLHYVGHPPKGINKSTIIMTCDLPICNKCSTEIARGIDYCDNCVNKIIGKRKKRRNVK